MNQEKLLEGIVALLQARSEAELTQVLTDHIELLSDEADIMLQQLISSYRQHENTREEYVFGQLIEFLRFIRSGSMQSSRESELSQILQDLYRPTLPVDMTRRVNLCQRALQLVSPKNAQLWAMLCNELGKSLVESPLGDRAENLERAINHYNQALKVRTQKDFPADWAATQNNLANAYKDRIRGNRSGNIEHAIIHCDQALKVFTQKDFPIQWAMAQNNLGAAYNVRIQGEKADNIEQAIIHYDQALKVRTQKDFPADWAMTQNNLAAAYLYRIRGDRADNIERAIIHYDQARKVFTQKDFPMQWAGTHHNLAAAYNDRIRGDKTDNIKQAISHYKHAMKVFTQKDFPIQWAGTQNNLANAYINCIRGDRAKNIEHAIEHYELALKVRTEKDFPEDWAATQNNLAGAYYYRVRSDRTENIERAIKHYDLALKVRVKKDFPEDWAQTQKNLATAYSNRIRGNRADNIEHAIAHYEQALKVYTPGQFPDRCRETAYMLGNLCLEGQRFSLAGKAYTMGMEAAEDLYRAALSQSSREIELTEVRDLYRRAGYALAMSGDRMREAVAALERGRARGLGDALARDRVDLERIRERDREAYELYSQAVQIMQRLESQERAGASGEEKALPPRDLIMQARARLNEAVDRIRRIPDYKSFLAEPGWEEIAAAAVANQPLVYIAVAPGGGMALIVHRSPGVQDASVEMIPLNGFSEERLQEHIKTWFEAYSGWQKALFDMSLDYGQAEEKWFYAIESVTGSLWREVAEPVYAALQSLKTDQAFLIPTGLLALLPLHAAWRDEGERKQYLQDLLPVSYIPSARSLAHARRMASSAGSEKLLAIDEPRPVKASPLRNSHAEVSAISYLFRNPQILEHEKATREAARRALPGAQVAHFSCHGGANWSDPEQSGLLMANDEVLTVKDLFELHLAGARLATLSACETGVPGARLPDEVVSLPSAFIRAGFAGAIGSLWTVPDESTAQLMTSFYQLRRVKGMPPVQALAEAQKMLRESEKFQHPFYWAAFYLTGV